MAIQPSTITRPEQSNTIQLVLWNAMANGDSGTPYQFTDWADRCVQISSSSVFGAGGTVVFEGSNNWNNILQTGDFETMTDQNGNAMSYTAATIKQCTEAPLWVRPRVTAGDGTTSIIVCLCARRLYQLY